MNSRTKWQIATLVALLICVIGIVLVATGTAEFLGAVIAVFAAIFTYLLFDNIPKNENLSGEDAILHAVEERLSEPSDSE